MSNPEKNKFSSRRARPQTLAGAVGALMQMFGPRASDADLVARWDVVMGADLASMVRLASIKKTPEKKFNIALRATNPAFALQLSYRLDEIRARIDQYFGYAAVAKISIRK